MKPSNLMITIPEPCHEDWNKMQPDEKGKFCGSCSKSVFDFTNKTDTEIKNILTEYQNQKVCGHFKKTQINRPLNISIDLNNLPKNISTTKAFAIALFLVFGTLLFSCTDEKSKTVGEIEFVQPKPQDNNVQGLILAPPQIDTVAKIQNTETVDGQIMEMQNFVSGGLRIESIPAITDSLFEVSIIAAKDSSVVDTVVTETIEKMEMMGMMVMTIVPRDTTTTDSVAQKNTTIQIGDNVISKQTDLSVYPNPNTGEFTIKYDVVKRSDIRIDIFDIKGALIKTVVNVSDQYSGKYQIPVNLNELEPGIYFVNLINNGKRSTEKVVIGK